MYCMFPLFLLLECQDYNYNYNYKSLIRLEVVKTDSPNFYKPHTSFAVVNLRASTSHIYTSRWLKQTLRRSYKHHARIAVDSPNFYKLHIRC